MLLPYETVFSRTRTKIDDVKELFLDENDLLELNTERLRSIVGDERVINKFSSFTMDDEIQQIEFKMKYPVSDFADKEYVTELFALGMSIQWLKPKVDSINYTARALGTKEEKNIQNNYSQLKDRLDSLEHKFSQKLASHGYINNSYLRGE